MTHRHHRPRADVHVRAHGASGSCATGKIAYTGRSDAKAVAALMKTRGVHLRPYRCQRCRMWHVGHLPQAALAGLKSAADVYVRRQAAS